MHVSGASNGGMFTYYLSSQRPNLFKSWWMNYAVPLKGYINTPAEIVDKHILIMHGRQDSTIPYAGGVDGSNQWIYESQDDVVQNWAII